jgi:tetratricopeptide (TPR) repeat protein
VYFRQGKLPLALAQLDHVATYYEERQQLDLAIETLEQAVKLAPNTIAVRSRLAHVLIRRGILDRGLRELTEVAQLQKSAGRTRDAVASMQHAAEAYWMLGKHAEAFKLYKAIVVLVPEDYDLRHQLVNLHLLAGQNEQAIAELHRIVQAYVRAGNTGEAIAALYQITGLAPTDAAAFEELARLLSETGQHDQALRIYQRLQRLWPDDAEVAARLQECAAQVASRGATGQAVPLGERTPAQDVETPGIRSEELSES